MSNLLVVLFSAAITVVFTQGKPTAFVREHGPALWRELASCPLCSGVWIGALSSALVGGTLSGLLRVYEALALGTATGCLAWLFVALLNVMGSLEVWLDGEQERAKAREKRLAEAAERPEGPRFLEGK
jgi:hypothetical protein